MSLFGISIKLLNPPDAKGVYASRSVIGGRLGAARGSWGRLNRLFRLERCDPIRQPR